MYASNVDKDCARRATESADGRCDGSQEFVVLVVVDRTDVTTIHCSPIAKFSAAGVLIGGGRDLLVVQRSGVSHRSSGMQLVRG
jgi:hypothetical protein